MLSHSSKICSAGEISNAWGVPESTQMSAQAMGLGQLSFNTDPKYPLRMTFFLGGREKDYFLDFFFFFLNSLTFLLTLF